MHTHTHTHTSGLQLKIIFLKVLNHSENCETNILNFFFTKTASSASQQKGVTFSAVIPECILNEINNENLQNSV